MLHKILIKNYALIDNLEIEFDKGMNIITGETGAGKSIILGALSLILGQRADSKSFFNQDKKCIIEGYFISKSRNLKITFEENDLDFYDENILRREIAIDGKSRAFVNDTPVSLAILKQISEQLIAVHSQHATLEITNHDFQLLILDSLAEQNSEFNQYKFEFKKLKTLEKQLAQLIKESEEARNQQDYEQFLFEELEQAQLQSNEQEELEAELQKLSNAEQIKVGLINGLNLLESADYNAHQFLKQSIAEMSSIEKYDKQIIALNERLKSCLIEIKDICTDITSIEESILHDNQQLEKTQQRLDIIYTLEKKHRVTSIEELIVIQSELVNKLMQISTNEENIKSLEKQILNQQQNLKASAELIHKNRLNKIEYAELNIANYLAKMGMPNAKIAFKLSKEQELNINGYNKIELLFSANAGQELANVSKVASGGELSRLILAIKALVAKHTELAGLVFDEIDTGISGETALNVGTVINELAQNMQIIAITHLPQIASIGQTHYFVYKNEISDKTTTHIKKLSREERINAIAEMLSGKNPGLSAIENAKELLS